MLLSVVARGRATDPLTCGPTIEPECGIDNFGFVWSCAIPDRLRSNRVDGGPK